MAAFAAPAGAEPPPFGGITAPSSFGTAVPPSFDAPGRPPPATAEEAAPAGQTPAAPDGGGVPLVPRGAVDASPVRLSSPYMQLGDFGIPYSGAPPTGGASGRDWSIVPSLGVQLIGSDNALNRTDRRADLITMFTPSILATADTLRLRGTLNYAPVAQIYARTGSQTRVDQRFAGEAVAAIIPNRLFLDVRGFSTVQAVTGGFAPQTTSVAIDQRNTVQTTAFQVSPYIVHRFGSLATAQVGYAFQYGNQDGNQITAPGTNLPFFTSQEYTAHEGFALLRTGEDFGRLALQARLDGTVFDGTGVLDNAHRNFATVEARYALLPGIAALVEGGYEDQRYAGAPRPLRINDAIWTVGVFLTPSPNSVVTAGYRHLDGFEAPFLNARIALGGRTVLFASYNDRLLTPLRRTQSLLATTTLDAQGNPTDFATGAPLLLADSFLAVQSSLFRTRTLNASLSQTWPRDQVTLSVTHEERLPAAVAPGLIAFKQRGTSGSLLWQHELAPRTVATGYVQYGNIESVIRSGDVFTFGASLAHSFSENLVGLVQFIRTDRNSDQPGNRSLQHAVLAGLRMSVGRWGP